MAEVTPIRTAAETALLARFPTVRQTLPGAGALRDAAFARFSEAGLPHRRVEAWKYTDLRALLREAASPAVAPDAAAIDRARQQLAGLHDAQGLRLVLVDGALASGLTVGATPEGVRFRSLSEVLAGGDAALLARLAPDGVGQDDAVLALNTAFMTDGVVIEIAEGASLDVPVEIVSVATSAEPTSIVTRSVVLAGKGAKATILETHVNASAQRNTALVLDVADGGEFEHVVQFGAGPAPATQGMVLASSLVALGADVKFRSVAVNTGVALVRNQIFLAYRGENTHATLGGAALLRGREHSDTTLVVDHAVPHCESRELYKHVLDGESTGVFQGKIVVLPIAQKTDGRMMSQAVLLADGATMNNKPELEIFADDVQCAHGATCGALDDDLLFYLRARGLPKPDAEALMLQAFAGEALEIVQDETVRSRLEATVERWLRERM
jgi:Fe-S cluster assembly protein SufD